MSKASGKVTIKKYRETSGFMTPESSIDLRHHA